MSNPACILVYSLQYKMTSEMTWPEVKLWNEKQHPKTHDWVSCRSFDLEYYTFLLPQCLLSNTMHQQTVSKQFFENASGRNGHKDCCSHLTPVYWRYAIVHHKCIYQHSQNASGSLQGMNHVSCYTGNEIFIEYIGCYRMFEVVRLGKD